MTAAATTIWPGRFKGKRALVTGASRGIGAAIARRLGAEGALVGINYRTRSHEAEQVAREIVERGGQAFTIEADIASVEAIKALFSAWDETATKLVGDNRLDILVNNAGIASAAPLTEIVEHAFDRVMNINMKGTAFMSQNGATRMTNGGRIVSIGSGAAKQPGAMNGAYAMSKAALLAMTRSLAVELGPHAITANVVSPGYTQTDMTAHTLSEPRFAERVRQITALRRLGEPDDIAAVVTFLA